MILIVLVLLLLKRHLLLIINESNTFVSFPEEFYQVFNMQSILPDACTLRNLVKKRGNLSTNFKCFINGFFEVIVPRDPDVRPNALTAGKKAATSASPPPSSASAAKFG